MEHKKSDYINNLIHDLKYCQSLLITFANLQSRLTPNKKGALGAMADLLGVHINHLQNIADYQKGKENHP